MSITPHDPESSAGSAGEAASETDAGRHRWLADRLRAATRAILRRIASLWAFLAATRHRWRESPPSGDAGGTGLQRGPVAKLRPGGVDRRADRGEEIGTERSPSAELPPRPTLDVEETEDGLRLSRPGRSEAYLKSDQWESVDR